MLKPIKTEAAYDDALARVYAFMQIDLVADSANSDELEILSLLIKEYELVYYPIYLLDGVAQISLTAL